MWKAWKVDKDKLKSKKSILAKLTVFSLAQVLRTERVSKVTWLKAYLIKSILGHAVIKEMNFPSFIFQITK